MNIEVKASIQLKSVYDFETQRRAEAHETWVRRFQALADQGAKLFVCAYGCQKRRQPLSDKATNCGLVVLADIVNATDRFLALN
jgi:hypothetical protein